jgi:hypothetical protein
MRTLVLAVIAAVTLVALPLQSQAQAATDFAVWPAQFSYGTPSGPLTWDSTVYGLRFDSNILPHFGYGTDLYFGSVSNLALGGSGLSGFGGQTVAGDLTLRLGGSLGSLDLTAYGGYEALALNATGPTAADRILLLTSGPSLGAEAKLHLFRGLALRGGITYLPSLNSSANLSFSSPPSTAQFSGTGNGTEYEVDLSYSVIPAVSVFAGYRAGNYQTSWSGSGSTTTSFSGWLFGLESRF